MSDGIPKSLAESCDIVRPAGKRAWLIERQPWMHASDGAAILTGNQTKVYESKVTPVPLIIDDTTNEAFLIKSLTEPTAREVYRRKYGGKVIALPDWTICVSKSHPWLRATPDSILEDPEHEGLGIHQIKCWSEHDKAAWAEEPPEYVQVQVQLEMEASGLKWGVISVLFGTNSERRFFVYPNQYFLEKAIPYLEQWWRNLMARVPPPIDGSDETKKALTRLHPKDNGLTVCLPQGWDERLVKLDRIYALQSRLKAMRQQTENELRAAMGDNTYAVTPGGEWYSWKTYERAGYEVPACEYRLGPRPCKAPKEVLFHDEPLPTDYRVHRRVRLPLALKLRLLRQYPCCRWCGRGLTLNTATWEHVVPLSVGGDNDIHNIDLACAQCNAKRGDQANLLEATRR